MNTALKARIKQGQKNTKKGKAIAKKTRKFRRKNFYTKPKAA